MSLSGQEKVNPTDTLKISGRIKNEKIFTLSDLDAYPKNNIEDLVITNPKGETKGTAKNIKGVLLKTVLEKIELQADKPKELNEFYFVFIASDGYKVVFSWNEIFNTETGNNLYIITEMDGKKIKEMDQRILLAATRDFITGRRYIKGLQNIIIEQTLESGVKKTKQKNKWLDASPKITGAMKNVMWKGQLYGTIDIDTIANKKHIYGLGPVEYLSGEIMLVDGKGFKSAVVSDSTMLVTETFAVKAPFFAYANIENWTETAIPDSISTIPQLESFLDLTTKNYPRPFFFKLNAAVDNAVIHVVNLPKGTKVASPDDAHKGQRTFNIKNRTVQLFGFFSTEHQAVFTHHNTYVHIHLITDDKQKMGHLDSLKIKKGTAKLFLPAQ